MTKLIDPAIQEKFQLVSDEIQQSKTPITSLLDAGCRECDLKTWLGNNINYTSLDISQNRNQTVQYVTSLEDDLPFKNGQFDVVTALDVVEHLDNFDEGMKKLFSLARLQLIVALPNMSHLLFRLRFIISGRLGEKYDLAKGNHKDRHRWVTILNQSDSYMQEFAYKNNADLRIFRLSGATARRMFLFKLGRTIHLPAPLWTWGSIYFLDKSITEKTSFESNQSQ